MGSVKRPGGGSVEVQEHADKQKEQERNAVEEENVRDVGDAGGGKEVHLFLRGAQEEEAGCVEELVYKSAIKQRVDATRREVFDKGTYKGRKILEAISLLHLRI